MFVAAAAFVLQDLLRFAVAAYSLQNTTIDSAFPRHRVPGFSHFGYLIVALLMSRFTVTELEQSTPGKWVVAPCEAVIVSDWPGAMSCYRIAAARLILAKAGLQFVQYSHRSTRLGAVVASRFLSVGIEKCHCADRSPCPLSS